jgi:hypothetical protein
VGLAAQFRQKITTSALLSTPIGKPIPDGYRRQMPTEPFGPVRLRP